MILTDREKKMQRYFILYEKVMQEILNNKNTTTVFFSELI